MFTMCLICGEYGATIGEVSGAHELNAAVVI